MPQQHTVTSLKLDDDATKHVVQIETSIKRYSEQHTQATIFAQKSLNTVMSLEEAKVNFLAEKIKQQGIDMSRVLGATLNSKTGEIEVQILPEPEDKKSESLQ